ncbi:hypothetical protein ACQKFM_09265 [Paenibacillus xylanexedens]|uniref:hypothetical protein n=1 Tax=Paenibacillus xylanexedens TaxID=528191 RepID=UPI003D06AE35
MVRKRVVSIASLLVVIVFMAFIVIFNNQRVVFANMGGNEGTYSMITSSVDIEITGVDDGRLYNTNVTPQFNIGTATLNGSPFTSGTQINAEGSYTLTVTAGS